jgi:hypothetical protein
MTARPAVETLDGAPAPWYGKRMTTNELDETTTPTLPCTCGVRDRDGAPVGCWHDDDDEAPAERNPVLALAVYGPVGYYDDDPGYSYDDEAF